MRTREQMEMETNAAKSVDILLIAAHFGYSLKRSGNTYTAGGSRGGLVLFKNTNSFYDYYARKGGSSIDFVMQEMDIGVREAIRYINEFAGNLYEEERHFTGGRQKIVQEGESRKHELKLPEKNFNHKRVFAYLTKTRGIDKNIVSDMLHRKMLYESAEKHNAVFVAYDKNGYARHGFIRGTITGIQYRGDASGSDKEYGFAVEGKSDSLVVFEAPIDLLSYMSIHRQCEEHLLALGGLSDGPLLKYMEEHPCIRSVSFLLDNDEYGMAATSRFRDILERRGMVVFENNLADEIKSAGVKDVNAYLLQQKQREGIEKSVSRAERRL